MGEDSDNFEFSEDEVDNSIHDALVDNVLKLNKIQHVKRPHRSEPTSQVSEFNLVKSLKDNKNLIHINELTKVLKGRKSHNQITNKIKSTSSRNKTLLKPLEKPQAEHIKRTLNYEKSRLQLDKWEALVTSNRAAAQLIFPLDSAEKVRILEKRAEVYPSTFRIKSDLQKKLEALEPKVEEYHINTEEKNEYPLTLKELKEKRKEAAKLRAHQSFKEAKARFQNKIKSKKYHRILRRERIKQQLKEFEELQKVDPDEALKKLESIEKARAEERFSLRHKGTGQWAKTRQIRAKYDKESRQELAKQLAISRDLTQKLKLVESESEDEDKKSEDVTSSHNKTNEDNPWVNGIKPTTDVTDFVSGYRKYWNEKNNLDMKMNSENIEEEKETNEIIANQSNKIDNDSKKFMIQESESVGRKVHKKDFILQKTKEKTSTAKRKEMSSIKSTKKIKNVKSGTSQSTSDWEVSSCKNIPGDPIDVHDVFEILENKLSKNIEQKLKKIKNKTKTDKSKMIKIKNMVKNKKKIDLSLPSQKKRQIIDEEMCEQTEKLDIDADSDKNISDLALLKNVVGINHKSEESININPENLVKVKHTHLDTTIPNILTDETNEEGTIQKDIIMQAFEDDDIAEDFSQEKTAEIEKDTPKDIDLNLPGWGSWAGGGIDLSKKKRKRFIMKMPPRMPRRDDNKGSLIINEKAQAKIKPLLVSEVPFPFKSVKAYEASIRAPIGNTFVPEMAFKKFIEPSVVTKMGTIIDPINKSILMGVKKVF